MSSTFTAEQIKNWDKFEHVRVSRVINMYDSHTGCEITGMSRDEWLFCMMYYEQLQKAFMEAEKK